MFGLIPFNKNNTSEFGGALEDFLSDDFFLSPVSAFGNFNKFCTDVKETDNEYIVCAELPGVKKEDISLNYANNNLVITAKREETHDDNKDNYIRRERSYGEFSRSFYLENINKEGIKAKFENGELKVTLPKQVSKKDKESRIFIE